MVGMLDSLSLKNTKLGLETLELMGYDPDRIAILLNRADTRVGITREDVDAIIGKAPSIFVPSDRQIPISVNDGVPIVMSDERTEAARSFRLLADLYDEEQKIVEAERQAAAAPIPEPKPRRRFAWR